MTRTVSPRARTVSPLDTDPRGHLAGSCAAALGAVITLIPSPGLVRG
jgi:hypothetical protein